MSQAGMALANAGLGVVLTVLFVAMVAIFVASTVLLAVARRRREIDDAHPIESQVQEDSVVAELQVRVHEADLLAQLLVERDRRVDRDRRRSHATLRPVVGVDPAHRRPADQGGRRLSLTGTGRAAGVTVEAYGYTETVGTTIQFIPIGSSNQPIAASGSMSGTNLVLTDLRSGERVSYRKR